MNFRQRLGQRAENHALNYLQNQGLQLLSQNFHCKLGEIDLIMQDKDQLVFVEVRYRRDEHFGSVAGSVNTRKQQKIIKTAQYYLMRNESCATMPCRFDVVAVRQAHPQNHIEWIKHAFIVE